jgi:hypothetical protein
MFVGQPNSNRQLQILVSINGIYTQNYLNGKNMIDRVFFGWVSLHFPDTSRFLPATSFPMDQALVVWGHCVKAFSFIGSHQTGGDMIV